MLKNYYLPPAGNSIRRISLCLPKVEASGHCCLFKPPPTRFLHYSILWCGKQSSQWLDSNSSHLIKMQLSTVIEFGRMPKQHPFRPEQKSKKWHRATTSIIWHGNLSFVLCPVFFWFTRCSTGNWKREQINGHIKPCFWDWLHAVPPHISSSCSTYFAWTE